MAKKHPAILFDAARHFSNPATCARLLRRSRWPDGVPICPDCGSIRTGRIVTRKLLRCKDCRKQFGLKQGTIFEDSPLDLGQWFLCLYAITHTDTTCEQLSDLLGVTLRTAWQMRRKLNAALYLTARPGCITETFNDTLKRIISVSKSEIKNQLKHR